MNKKELIKQLIVAEKENPTTKINTPNDVVPMLMKYSNKKEENFYVILLNSRNEVMGNIKHITKGLVNRTMVHPREIFRMAISKNAVSIIIAHNHPSGALEDSKEDREITQRLKQVGDIIGIPVLDHIIFSKNGYSSFLENNKMPL